MATNALTYLKNVGKSFGYSTIDVLSEHNEGIFAFGRGAKELAENLYETINDFKESTTGAEAEKGLVGFGKSLVHDMWVNTIEDAKSGNWYNKARIDKQQNEVMMEAFGLDDDLFADFDVDSFDFDDDDDFGDNEDSDTDRIIESSEQNKNDVIIAMDAVGAKVSSAVATSNIKSAEYIAASEKENAKALYNMHLKGYNQVSTGLAAINATISSIAQPLTTHMQNAGLFYTKSTEYQNKALELLEKIAANTAPPEPDRRSGSSVASLSSIMEDGVLNLGSYFDFIKENVKKQAAELNDYAEMFGGLEGIKKMLTGSPLKLATDGVVKLLIPNMMKQSMDQFNEAFTNFFPAMFNKLQKTSLSKYGAVGSFFDLVKGFMIPKDRYTDKPDVSNFERGRVVWDGISRTALVRVIPTHLAHIEAALTGTPAVMFDYSSGKFKTMKEVREDARDTKQRYASRAAGELRYDLGRVLDNNKNINDARKKQIKDNLDAFLLKAFEKGSGYEDILKGNFKSDEWGLDPATLSLIRSILMTYPSVGKTGRATGFLSGMREERDSYGEMMRRMTTDGNLEIALYDGTDKFKEKAKGKGGLLGKDQYNHDIWFYLQGIYQYTGHLSDNIGVFGNGSGGPVNRRSISSNQKEYTPIRPLTVLLTDKEREEQAKKIKDQEDANSQKDIIISQDEVIRNIAGTITADMLKDLQEKDKNKKDDDEDKGLAEALKGYGDRLKNARNKNAPLSGIRGLIEKITQGPIDLVTGLLHAGEISMSRMLFGQEISDEPGIFGYFYEKADNLFKKFDEHFEKIFKFSLSAKFNSIVDKVFGQKGEDGKRTGGKLSPFYNATRNSLREAGEWAFGSLVDVYGTKKARQAHNGVGETTPVGDNGQAAFGRRQVTKTGIVAVSKGEMIIPSEFNPFYHGTTNKSSQIRAERNAINRFYGSFAEGGTVEGEESKKNFTDMASDSFQALKSGTVTFLKSVFGGEKGQQKKDEDKVQQAISTASQELKDPNKAGGAAAGALIGGGVSLLTGAVVGPLLGAAIGGAVGLTIKSNAIQDLLFGKQDKKGNRKGGLLPKSVSNLFTKNLPAMGKGGIAGLVGGTFLGSPVLGAILGSTIGYVQTSDKAKDYLFGKKDKKGNRKGGLIPKDVQDNVKKFAPTIGAGVLAAVAAGPFGLVGNLALGGSLGYLSTTQKFQEAIFGKENEEGKKEGGIVGFLKTKLLGDKEKGKKGLYNWFKEDFFNPVVGIFTKIANETKIHIRDSFSGIGKGVRRIITNKFDEIVKYSRFGRFLGRVGGKIKGGIKGIGHKIHDKVGTFNPVKRLNNRLDKRALRKGYSIYDVSKGRNLTEQERLDRMAELGMSTTGMQANMSTRLENMSEKELRDLYKNLGTMIDPSKHYDDMIHGVGSDINRYVSDTGLGDKDVSKIQKLIRSGNGEKLSEYLNSVNLTDEQRENITSKFGKLEGLRADRKTALKDKSKLVKDLGLQTKFQKLGITKDSDSGIKNLRERIKNQIDTKFNIRNGVSNDTIGDNVRSDTLLDKQTESVLTIQNLLTDVINKGIKINSGDEEGENAPPTKDDIKEATDKIVEGVSGSSDPKHTTTIDAQGNPTEMEYKNGKMVPANKESKEEMEKVQESARLQNESNAAIVENFGSKSEGGGLLSKLFGGGEEGGLFSKIFGGLTGGLGLKGLFGKITGGASLGNLVKGGASLAALYAILSGKLDQPMDDVTRALGNDPYNATNGAMSKSEVITEDGKVQGFNNSLSIRTIQEAIRGSLFGRSSLVGKLTKNVANAVPKIAKSIANGFIGILKRVAKFLPENMAKNIDDFVADVSGELAEQVAKSKEVKKGLLNKLLGSLALPLKVVTIVSDFITGREDAASMLGVIDEPDEGTKTMCGLIRAAYNCIPILSIIPESVILDIVFKIGTHFGYFKDWAEDRKRAEEEVAAFNEEHGTNYNIEEYNKHVLGKWTTTEKIGNFVKTTWSKAKTALGIGEKTEEERVRDAVATVGMPTYNTAQTNSYGINMPTVPSYARGGVYGGASGISSSVGAGEVVNTISGSMSGIGGSMNISRALAQVQKLLSSTNSDESMTSLLDKLTVGGESEGGMTGMLARMSSTMIKMMMSPMAVVSQITKAMSGNSAVNNGVDMYKNLKDKAKNLYDRFTGTMSDTAQEEVDQADETNGENWLGKIKNSIGNLWNKFKSMFSSSAEEASAGAGSSISGAGSGVKETFVSQRDDKYKDMKFAGSTVGDVGCAPAVASMLVNQNSGAGLDMRTAVNDARRYQNAYGTSADYFGDVFARHGIGSKYYNTTGAGGQRELIANLRAGRPTVLLGQDSGNGSKANSPFGSSKHFVIGKYMDRNGNVIVDDPESSTPNTVYGSNILKNVSLGISTTAMSGGGSLDTATARAVWGYFTSRGYTPQATAGIMGNMFCESSMDPTKIQKGSGAAAGICQWQYYSKKSGRWLSLSNYAQSRGKDWTDLECQLDMVNAEVTGDGSVPGADSYTASLFRKWCGDFRAMNSVDEAARMFCKAFERPKNPDYAKRISYANQYYSIYNGSQYTGSYASDGSTPNSSQSSESTGSTDASQEKKQLGLSGILSGILGAFTNAFNFDGNKNESESSDSATTSNSSSTASGAVAVSGGNDKQIRLVEMMNSKIGQLTYSQKGPRDPEKGSADCSSTVNWAYKKVFGKSIGNNTGSILNSDTTEIIDMANGMDPTKGGSNSSGPNVSKLQPGDILLYSRPDSGYSASRKYRVGHVEMYAGNNQRIGHGGPGMGPNVSSIDSDAKHYIMAKRLKDVGAGSGLIGRSGGSSSIGTPGLITSSPIRALSQSTGYSSNTTINGTPTLNDSNVAAALSTIVSYVKTIATNTQPISAISTTLTNYCGEKIATDVTAAAATTAAQSASNKVSPEDDPGLKDLMDTLNVIAAG